MHSYALMSDQQLFIVQHSMNLDAKPLSSSSNLLIFLTLMISNFASSSLDSFIYVGCSQLKYTPGGSYDSTVNSILTSVVNAASSSTFNTFNISLPAGDGVVFGLFQCRGDLSNSDCHSCVSNSVSRLGSSCAGSAAGAMQLEGCFVRYDNTSFIGVEDKTVVSDKCGPSTGDESGSSSGREAALADLTAGSEYYRISGSRKVQGVAQCTEDLTVVDCQDCLAEAIQRLKSECASSASGDMFLGKCYARYSERGFTSKSRNNEEEEKTLAMFIGIVAGIAVLIIILSILRNVYGSKGGNGK